MRNESVDLWAMDEVHFQQHGSRCRMWVAPEIKDPVLLHAPTRKKVGYFGAVRLRDGRFLFAARRTSSMAPPSCAFFAICGAPVLEAVAASWLSATTPGITMPFFIRTGASNRPPDLH
jgi:hypothetical protein